MIIIYKPFSTISPSCVAGCSLPCAVCCTFPIAHRIQLQYNCESERRARLISARCSRGRKAGRTDRPSTAARPICRTVEALQSTLQAQPDDCPSSQQQQQQQHQPQQQSRRNRRAKCRAYCDCRTQRSFKVDRRTPGGRHSTDTPTTTQHCCIATTAACAAAAADALAHIALHGPAGVMYQRPLRLRNVLSVTIIQELEPI